MSEDIHFKTHFRDPGSRVQFPAGGLGVAFFASGSGRVSKGISF